MSEANADRITPLPCKVKAAFASYVANVTETAKRCYIDATRIVFKEPKCDCGKCAAKTKAKTK